jgi:hypothetical protein
MGAAEGALEEGGLVAVTADSVEEGSVAVGEDLAASAPEEAGSSLQARRHGVGIGSPEEIPYDIK